MLMRGLSSSPPPPPWRLGSDPKPGLINAEEYICKVDREEENGVVAGPALPLPPPLLRGALGLEDLFYFYYLIWDGLGSRFIRSFGNILKRSKSYLRKKKRKKEGKLPPPFDFLLRFSGALQPLQPAPIWRLWTKDSNPVSFNPDLDLSF